MAARWARALRNQSIALACKTLGFVIRPKAPRGSILPDEPRPAVLIVKPCSIGDVLEATAFLGVLRRSMPAARISLAVGAWSRVAVEGNPAIDEVIDCGGVGTPGNYRLRDLMSFARDLRRRRFDVCFVLDRSPLMTILPMLAGIPYRIGLDSRGRGFALTKRVHVDDARRECDIYLDVARSVGFDATGAAPSFHPQEKDAISARRIMEEWGLVDRPLAVIAPGGGRNPGGVMLSKRWSPAGFAAVADRLARAAGTVTVFVGQDSDAAQAESVRALMSSPSVSLIGRTSFGVLGAIVQRAALFVGNDSAPAHLAAAVGTPLAVVFTDTDPRLYCPCSPSAVCVRADGIEKTVDCVVAGLLSLIHPRDAGGDREPIDPGGVRDAPGSA